MARTQRKQPTLEQAVERLADKLTLGYLHQKSKDRIARATCRDLLGVHRSKVWTELCRAGYVTPDAKGATAGQTSPKALAEVTAKAAGLKLADLYTWDQHAYPAGWKTWLSWSYLPVGHKAAVVARDTAEPGSIEFLAVLDYEKQFERFYPHLGETPSDAYARLGKEKNFWDGHVAVRDAELLAKADAAAKAEFMSRIQTGALDAYLEKVDVRTKAEPRIGVTAEDRDSLFGPRGPRMPADPDKWTEEVLAAFVKASKDAVTEASAKYGVARRFAEHVVWVGGIEKFREKYLAAVAAEVDKRWAEKDSPKEPE